MNWRPRHADFPAPFGGTDIHPEFDRSAVASWLLDHDEIEIPSQIPPAMLLLDGGEGATRLRLDGPLLLLADDTQEQDQLTGWTTEDDADTLAKLTAGEFGASLRRLAAPGAAPLAVPGEVRLIDLFRNGSGGLKVTLVWPAALRGAASAMRAEWCATASRTRDRGRPACAGGTPAAALFPSPGVQSTGRRSSRSWNGTRAVESGALTWLAAVSAPSGV
ncbi:hypothetical protein [Streptomyces erythrochromogenes]|uniref:hypothetical protein n=1 Tax=Streptomyces erythrochromogenes TaxID=285574 RepID=UPI0036AE2576